MKTLTANAGVTSRIQRNWDWRAAGNFIGGGTGSGLIICATLFSLAGFDSRVLMLAGLALVGAGLFCVWLEIGRPWRALNVFKHLAKSWMSREAWVAPLLFISGAAAWLWQPPLVWLTALLALLFLYSQSRILQADKGIPAWRHPRCAQLIVATGLAEGCGLLLVLLPLFNQASQWSWAVLLMLLAARSILWTRYRAGLAQSSAPVASQKRLAQIDKTFQWAGHWLPALLLLVASVQPQAALLAGALALLSGAWMKYTLICKAAYTQGFSLPQQPVRGQSHSHRSTPV